MKPPRRVLLGVVVLVGAGLSLLVGMRQSPPKCCSVWIDAARPITIEAPFEVVEIGAHGELGVWLPAEAGQGWRGEAGGEATYRFYAAADGPYTIWAYCLWDDACTNAVYVQIDDARKSILGNDPVYGTWHWVRGFDVPLKKGFHELRLSNHSPNIAVRKLFLTNEQRKAPSASDAAQASVLFRDDFNGCDHGNFALWRQVAGEWQVRDRKASGEADNVLVGTSRRSAIIVYERGCWGACRLTVSAQCPASPDQGTAIGIRFAVVGDDEYEEIRLSCSPDEGQALAEHVRCRQGIQETLADGPVPWQCGAWHELELDRTGEQPALLVDRGAAFRGGKSRRRPGGIGLAVYGDAEVRFDDVLVQAGRQDP